MNFLITTENSIFKNFKGIIVLAYLDTFEAENLIHIGAYRQNLHEIASFFKLSSIFNCECGVDAFAIDCLENEFRFTIIYKIQSLTGNINIRLITKTADSLALISLQNIYPAFNWAEREIWDLSGIFFIKHPDLRRILTDYGFSGHPLRKDFPVSGFREIHYSDIIKQITYNDIELQQSFRLPCVTTTWNFE